MSVIKRNFVFVLIFICSQTFVFAQKEKLKEADKMFERFAFIDAREIYLEVADAGYKSENLYKKLGDSYYFNGELPKSLKWYDELYHLKEGDLEEEYLFRYAMALKSDQRYKESDDMMLEFERVKGKDSRVELLKGERNYLELIELQSGKFDIEVFPVNSKLSDFSPTFFQNKLVFASNKETSSSVKRIHEWNKQPYLDLYSVNISKENQPQGEPEAFPKVINSKFHESSATFTKDGLTVYFTRNNYNNKKYGKSEEGINFLKIYKSTRESAEADWNQPEELPFNSDDYSVAHPALNPTETKLYFSSDMPGTTGLSDIFVVDINEDGSFGEVQNLGNRINTEGRETFPFVSDDNELYFASDGHIGLGGLDVFVTVLKDDQFGEVFNVGRPINSSKDDFSFIVNSSTHIGYVASNREGGQGEDDIYQFKQNDELITSCQQYVSGTVKEEESRAPISEVKVELFDEELNLLDTTTTNEEGFYKLTLECDKKYIIRVSKDNYETSEKLLESGSEFEKSFELSLKIKEGDNLGVAKAGVGDDLSKLLQLDPIYFDLDKSDIRPDAEVELQKVLAVLNKYPKMKIDVRSHTDSRGGDPYNLFLSEKRAQSTVDYLVSRGIDKSRISGKGYGETQLLNACEDGVECTEAQHQLNRRAEFIILNENETPEEIRDQIAIRTKPESKAKEESSVAVKEVYDFSKNKEAFTVQIGAFKRSGKTKDFKNIPNTFSHAYADGYQRYYSRIFENRAEAERYKLELRQKGFDDAFVVGLRGEQRF